MLQYFIFFYSILASCIALSAAAWWFVTALRSASGSTQNGLLACGALFCFFAIALFMFRLEKFREQLEWEVDHHGTFLPDEPTGRKIWAAFIAAGYFALVTSYLVQVMDSLGMASGRIPDAYRLSILYLLTVIAGAVPLIIGEVWRLFHVDEDTKKGP